mgnify:CR=1 FL=1
MATPDEVKKQKELNDLLDQENKILREKLRLQSDSYDLSSTLLEDLKEILGIRSKLTTYEKGIYDINKQINRSIRDQKVEYEDVSDITKQIKKKKRYFTFNNTNPLVATKDFIISKTGYIRASGGCIVMMLNTKIGQRIVVLLNSRNTHTRIPEAYQLAMNF